ncbi:serine-rich coiled-coil domain-containing protein 1 isoform X1 [Oryzias melastigma]|uniref:Coiled-coil serine-rich protein 1 n=2 Tax=Oryzias melastigma TaxID=30732 RepID=A0A3B3E0N4_ORYME|nr:serine-rich coiled-coil domain-containing protein 1 isoform X1 [Oryzias melastigma]XP_024131323.1 serine-rich coiled-coil domain-containing protein 1 isoform X1 [Oryzias melastigma]
MGESGSRRSTLVSRLPIFRRSNSKRQESLPSSPSSGGVGNGVHTSSPSSTNSSSGSTGKRRSLFRTPSLGFTSKRNNDPPVQPINLNLPQPQTQTTDANGNNQPTVTPSASTRFNDGGGRPKSRHSFGFGSHKQKKIPRSQTEDFDKASSSSSSANRNVFINCISSSGTNEGDDSGFLDDYSGGSNNNRRSSRQKKQLLPKSFSAHHRFSRTSDHHRPPEVNLEPSSSTTVAPGTGGLTPGSWPGELIGPGGESSLQSPMISEDRTTAITPSEFVPATEDSVSEVDALPAPSPGSAVTSVPDCEPALPADPASPEPPPAQENISAAVTTSQVFFSPVQSSTEKPLLPDTSTANNTDYDTAVSLSEPETAVPCLPLQEQSQEEREEREEERQEAQKEELTENKSDLVNERKPCLLSETTSESEANVARSEGCHSNPERPERRARTSHSFQERGSFCGCHEPRASHLRKPHAASLCSSASPYHEVMRMERRLRSSSEGAGGPRIHGNQSDAPGMEGCGLLKHRNNSSSSKMGSLDVLNNLGSSELDEDDLMLDLDYSDDQRHRHVSREDSSQSLTSCLNLLPSPMDASGDRIPGKEGNQREPSRPTSLLPAEWSMGLGLSKEEELLPSGLEALPFRLMQQDCTAVKTLLLRLRRTLQESTETSPASSLQSLPISPCSEKSLPFKDLNREEVLLQQLREKDELIIRLQNELESAKAALKMKDCQMTDRTTQTEHMGPELSHPGRWSGLGNSSSLAPRDRRVVRAVGPALGGDLANQHHLCHYTPLHGRPTASERHTAREERHSQPALTQSAVRNPVLNFAPGPSKLSTAQASPTTSPQLQAFQSSPNQLPESNNTAPPLCSKQPEAVSSSSESLTPEKGPGGSNVSGVRRGGGDHLPPSHIPRSVGASTSSSLHSLTSKGSPSQSQSTLSTDQVSISTSNPSSAASSSSFTGRLGQPPRGPLSLHSYSRKNVFLQHSLHTAELQALTQRDS